MRIFFLLLAMVLIASFPFISNFLADKSGSSSKSVEKIVEEYIANNPKKILDSIRNLEKEQIENESNDNFLKAFEENKNQVMNLEYPHIKGKTDNSIVVLEFFDYSCSYCKRMKEVTSALIKNKNATVIFRDFPILGEASMLASKFAIAVNMVDKERYYDFHLELLATNQRYTHESLVEILKKVMSNDEKVNKVMHILENENAKIENLMNATYELAGKMGIRGTPAFIVGKQLHVGFLSEKDLEVYIKDFEKINKVK